MTLKTSGSISFSDVNTERGDSSNSTMSIAWIRDNSYFQYKNLSSIYGMAYFQAKSSQNSITRSASSTTANCLNDCASQQPALINCTCDCSDCTHECNTGYLNNCTLIANVNCDQCIYTHGITMLQPNCNCNCQCWNCNCRYNNCDCTDCSGGFQC